MSILGVSTESAHYYLTAPSPNYKTFFNKIFVKAYVSKIVVEALHKANDNQDSLEYEDLLGIIESADVPADMEKLGSEDLINNASFVVAQVSTYEDAGDDDEDR